VEKLIKLLTQHEVGYNQDPEEYYYELRNNYKLKSCSDVIERAAQFITLNRTCFNGLYIIAMVCLMFLGEITKIHLFAIAVI
jgi:site-specific DNA-adenine methylase